jgi:CHAT domain-containing protein
MLNRKRLDILRDCFKILPGESYRGDFRAPERSVLQYVSTGAQKIAPRRPPGRLLKQSLGLGLGLALTLASCAKPPASAYDSEAAATSTAGTPVGTNTAGESCTSQSNGSGVDVYCGSWDQPSAQVRNGGVAGADTLQTLATTSTWRATLEGTYACNAPSASTILDGEPAEILSCTQRLGGWPHVAMVSIIGGEVYYADGVLPALPPMQRALGVLSGKVSASAASSVSVTSNAELAQRLSAEAFSSGDISHYESLMDLGEQSNQAEDFSSAVIAYRAALALQQQKLGANNPGTLEPMLELALNLSDQGRFPEADTLFATAATLAPASTDPTAPAKLLHYQGLDQLNQNHDQQALDLLRQAQSAYSVLLPAELLQPQPTGTDNTALFSISHQSDTSNFLATQSHLNSPITQGALLGVIETLRYQAIALRDMNQVQASHAAINAADELAESNDIAPPMLGARIDRTNASLAASSGKDRTAITDFADASANFTVALPGSLPVAETELLQASALQAQGSTAAALNSCRHGINLLKSLHLGTSPTLISPCLDVFAASATQQAANAGNAESLHAEMFEAAELAQGSVTAQEIGEAAARLSTSAANPKAAAAIRAQQDDTAALAALYQQRDAFTKSPPPAAGTTASPAQTLASIDKQIAAANATLQQDDLAVQAAAPNFGQLVQQVVSAKDVLNALRPDEGFLGITSTPDHTWLFLLHGQSIQVARSDVNDDKMRGLVKAVLNSIEPTQAGLPVFDMADASTIYADTLAPLSSNMSDVHELVIAPSGPLLALPFAVLPTAPASAGDLGNAPWLVRKTNLAYVPAAANFVSLRKIEGTSAAQNPWFGFGDFQPVTLAQARATYNAATCGESAAEFAGLPHLPYATLELKAAAAIFGASPADELLGTSFTVPNVQNADLKNYRILHFATHALLPTDLPCQSQPAIVTSAPAGATSAQDALLNTADVTNLHLDANLIVLSACNTGGGEAGGEALSGLARSFFYAGARALMVTQWSVNDQVSAYLVAETLTRLHEGADGGAAGSLRAAQLALINGAGHGTPAKLANPFFWAAFAVIGDGGGPTEHQLSALSASANAGL